MSAARDSLVTDAPQTTVGPHDFAPLKRWRNRGRCRACYWPESEHPRHKWSTARPLGEDCLPMRIEVPTRQPKPKPDGGQIHA